MGQINVELGRNFSTTISLNTAEDGGYGAINTFSESYPLGGNPAAMSEWFGYNHTAGPISLGIEVNWTYNAPFCPGDQMIVYSNSNIVVNEFDAASGVFFADSNAFIEVYVFSGTKGTGCDSPSIQVHQNSFNLIASDAQSGYGAMANTFFSVQDGSTYEIQGILGLSMEPGDPGLEPGGPGFEP
jgi:hypothetical protein